MSSDDISLGADFETALSAARETANAVMNSPYWYGTNTVFISSIALAGGVVALPFLTPASLFIGLTVGMGMSSGMAGIAIGFAQLSHAIIASNDEVKRIDQRVDQALSMTQNPIALASAAVGAIVGGGGSADVGARVGVGIQAVLDLQKFAEKLARSKAVRADAIGVLSAGIDISKIIWKTWEMIEERPPAIAHGSHEKSGDHNSGTQNAHSAEQEQFRKMQLAQEVQKLADTARQMEEVRTKADQERQKREALQRENDKAWSRHLAMLAKELADRVAADKQRQEEAERQAQQAKAEGERRCQIEEAERAARSREAAEKANQAAEQQWYNQQMREKMRGGSSSGGVGFGGNNLPSTVSPPVIVTLP